MYVQILPFPSHTYTQKYIRAIAWMAGTLSMADRAEAQVCYSPLPRNSISPIYKSRPAQEFGSLDKSWPCSRRKSCTL